MFKQEKLNIIKNNIEKRFMEFCDNYKTELGEPFCSYSYCESIINNLKKDYDNFLKTRDYELNFAYPYRKFIGKKKLCNNNYEKLQQEYSPQEQIYYVIYDKLKSIFKNLPLHIDISSIETQLTAKELYNFNYFIDTQPRCCFCGQLLEHSIKNNEEYVHADIEHLLPEFEFPQFILHPLNWAPCCKECNMGEKRTKFFEKESPQEDFEYFIQAIKEVATDFNNVHPLKLWQNIRVEYDTNDTNNDNIYYLSSSEALNNLMNLYGIKKRANLILNRCYNNLFNIIKNADIRSPESLEKLLENIASSNWHEINDGYSLNNSPQIWQEFIENILYDECKLMALWDEIKSSELRFL